MARCAGAAAPRARLGGARPVDRRAGARRSRPLRGRTHRAARFDRRSRGLPVRRYRSDDAGGLSRCVPRLRRRRLADAGARRRLRRPGAAASARRRAAGDARGGEPCVADVAGAHARRGGVPARARRRAPEARRAAEDREWRVADDDVHHRATGGQRSRPAAHAGSAGPGRRRLPDQRQQAVHHRRRARSDRQHRAPRARAAARCAGGNEGAVAVCRAEVARRAGRPRAQRRLVRRRREEDGAEGQPDLHDAFSTRPRAGSSASRIAGSHRCS